MKRRGKQTESGTNKHRTNEKGGITKLPQKYEELVGECNNLLDIIGNGSCQASSKAAILLQDPTKGPELAIEKNGYIVEHWEKMGRPFFTFRQTLKLGG